MRRRILAAALCALVFSSVAGAASAGDPKVEIVPADQAWADSMVLTSSDVGARWTVDSMIDGGSTGGGSGDGGDCAAPDMSDLTVTGGSSSGFDRDGGSVSSLALVWQTAEQAQADWDRNVTPSFLNCLAAELAGVKTREFSIKVTGKRQLAYPALAPRTAAYRVSYAYKFRVKTKKKRKIVSVPATFDFVALGNGRATAMLYVISLNKLRLNDAYKQSLAAAVARRMATDPNPAPTP